MSGRLVLTAKARWLALVLGCSAALVLGECGLRVVNRGPEGAQAPPSRSGEMLRFSDDVHQGWELRPDTLDHNSSGFRGPPVVEEKTEGTRRIVTVGDSITYGIGVKADVTFSALLEQLLNSTAEGRFEVLNLGVPGYGTHQVRRLVANTALAYEPDLVIMTFSPDDVETTPVVIEIDGEMCLFQNPFEGARFFDSKLHWTVFRISHLYRLLYKGLALMAGPSAAVGGDACVKPEVAWKNVEEVAALVERSGARFLLVLSPPVLPVCDVDGNPMVTPQVITRPLAAIRALSSVSGVNVLDLEPVFAPYAGQLKIAPQDHEHFNALGHRLVAEALLSKITSADEGGRSDSDNDEGSDQRQ